MGGDRVTQRQLYELIETMRRDAKEDHRAVIQRMDALAESFNLHLSDERRHLPFGILRSSIIGGAVLLVVVVNAVVVATDVPQVIRRFLGLP